MQLLCAPFTSQSLPSLHKIHQRQQRFSHTVISRHHHQCVGSIEGFILLLPLLVGAQYLSAKNFCQDIILTPNKQYLHSFFSCSDSTSPLFHYTFFSVRTVFEEPGWTRTSSIKYCVVSIGHIKFQTHPNPNCQ